MIHFYIDSRCEKNGSFLSNCTSSCRRQRFFPNWATNMKWNVWMEKHKNMKLFSYIFFIWIPISLLHQSKNTTEKCLCFGHLQILLFTSAPSCFMNTNMSYKDCGEHQEETGSSELSWWRRIFVIYGTATQQLIMNTAKENVLFLFFLNTDL